jgi:hypothetical protein
MGALLAACCCTGAEIGFEDCRSGIVRRFGDAEAADFCLALDEGAAGIEGGGGTSHRTSFDQLSSSSSLTLLSPIVGLLCPDVDRLVRTLKAEVVMAERLGVLIAAPACDALVPGSTLVKMTSLRVSSTKPKPIRMGGLLLLGRVRLVRYG